jgi:hypothetical protein
MSIRILAPLRCFLRRRQCKPSAGKPNNARGNPLMLPGMMRLPPPALILMLVTTVSSTPAPAQLPVKPRSGSGVQQGARPVARADTGATPWSHRVIPVLPGALFPANRVVAFYGNPRSSRMGILGALPPEQMLAKLHAIASEWEKADTTRT